MSFSVGLYHYRYQDCQYTGTLGQPDTLSYFIVPENQEDLFVRHEYPDASLGGYVVGLSILSGIARAITAVKVIFKEFSQVDWKQKNDPHRQELWNGGKNFFRGFIEICPLTGIFLFLYDLFRSRVFVQLDIQNEIEKKGDLAKGKGGIALDGKIICLIDLTDLKDEKEQASTSPEEQLILLSRKMRAAMIAEEKELLEFNEKEGKAAFASGAEGYKWKENTVNLENLIVKRQSWTIIP